MSDRQRCRPARRYGSHWRRSRCAGTACAQWRCTRQRSLRLSGCTYATLVAGRQIRTDMRQRTRSTPGRRTHILLCSGSERRGPPRPGLPGSYGSFPLQQSSYLRVLTSLGYPPWRTPHLTGWLVRTSHRSLLRAYTSSSTAVAGSPQWRPPDDLTPTQRGRQGAILADARSSTTQPESAVTL
jgi:hypothetical protein